ncbi:hypothetical protein C5167_036462 [Papaver somniferum]|uniref:Uncharacterized protein n=1 Tax=Papaver somniferum TaxID=3469 RepID=A0A4Y7I7A4_PAPSO|nr:hypothetical protein C5167_036462 [Papaver somniferum]
MKIRIFPKFPSPNISQATHLKPKNYLDRSQADQLKNSKSNNKEKRKSLPLAVSLVIRCRVWSSLTGVEALRGIEGYRTTWCTGCGSSKKYLAVMWVTSFLKAALPRVLVQVELNYDYDSFPVRKTKTGKGI